MSQGDLLSEFTPQSARLPKRRERATGPGRRARPLRALPVDRNWDGLLEIRDPVISFSELLLPGEMLELFAEVHLENASTEKLASHGLAPRRRFLFVGPPGCGKSATAEALADEMGLRLATVNLASIISSFLGDTAKNLLTVFEAASSEQMVVFFDEFDAIAKMRDDEGDHGELRRVVTSFLQLVDRFEGPSLLVAASNHPQLLDSAAWRRFDDVTSFDMPGVHEIRALVRLRLNNARREQGFDVEKVATECRGLSHSEVVRVLDDARRHHVLHQPASSALTTTEVLAAASAAQRRNQARS